MKVKELEKEKEGRAEDDRLDSDDENLKIDENAVYKQMLELMTPGNQTFSIIYLTFKIYLKGEKLMSYALLKNEQKSQCHKKTQKPGNLFYF